MGSFLDHYLAPLAGLIGDASTIEIALNADARVWVERAGDTHMSEVQISDATPGWVRNLADQIAREARQSLTEASPMLSASITFGEVTVRAQAILPPAAAWGAVVSLRLFRPRGAGEEPRRFDFLRPPQTSSEIARREAISAIRQLLEPGADPGIFLQAAVDARLNMIVSGGTSTGKTELARRLEWMIPLSERLVVIEDAIELQAPHANHVTLVASRNDGSERSADRLLQASLRLRPDRIILGEVRGKEAATFLDAINSGHGGSFTTLHADTARKALDKLALMILKTGTQLSFSEVSHYLRGSIDVAIQTGREGDRRGIIEVWFPALDPH